MYKQLVIAALLGLTVAQTNEESQDIIEVVVPEDPIEQPTEE